MYRTLGDWHADHERWQQACTRYAVLFQIGSLTKREVTTNSLDCLRYGAALVEAGDLAGYDRFRRSAIACYANSPEVVEGFHHNRTPYEFWWDGVLPKILWREATAMVKEGGGVPRPRSLYQNRRAPWQGRFCHRYAKAMPKNASRSSIDRFAIGHRVPKRQGE